MKILVIGGTGHVGTFLVPKLVANGHEVYVGTRGNTRLRDENLFRGAKFVTVDSKDDKSLLNLKEYKFDTVVDFPGTAYRVWELLKNDISHLVACGSLWMFGYPTKVPTPEEFGLPHPHKGYIERFEQIKKMQSESGKFKAVFSAVMPPNICGPGKIPLDPMGDRSVENQKKMMRGEPVILPDGPECLIGPCDAEDLASLFALVVENPEKSKGELFNGGAEYSVVMSDFVRIYSEIYEKEIPIERVSWQEYTEKINPSAGAWWHFYAHMMPDISKAKNLLGYKPKYTPEQTVRRAVEWMKKEGII